MKRYLIKSVSVATQENPNFAGETRVYLHGKHLCTEYKEEYLKFYAKEYGYNTAVGAAQRYKSLSDTFKWETEQGFWESTCEIIAVEV